MHAELPYAPVSGHRPCTDGVGWPYRPGPSPVSRVSTPHSGTPGPHCMTAERTVGVGAGAGSGSDKSPSSSHNPANGMKRANEAPTGNLW